MRRVEFFVDIKPQMDDIIIWNLRGHAVPLDQLVPKLVRRVRNQRLDAIIIDPIYKVIMGDENSASDMAAFCNQFDRICNETGCATIYCHHHSKGAQGAKRAMDRASGSGVFARDPDAQLDMIELELSEELKTKIGESDIPITAWRMESSLREFQNFKPVNFWFRYPVHFVEQEEELARMPTQGSWEAGKMKNKKSIDKDKANEDFRKAFWALRNKNGNDPSVEEMKTYLGVTQKTIYVRAKSMPDFYVKNAAVHAMISPQEEDGEQGRTEKAASNTPGITIDEDLLPWDAVIEDGDEEE